MPLRRSARQGPHAEEAWLGLYGVNSQLCRGEWEAQVPTPHWPHDVTINLCAFAPMLHIHKAVLPKIPHEELGFGLAVQPEAV